MNDQREKVAGLKEEVTKLEESLSSLINEESYPSIKTFFQFWEEIYERLTSLNKDVQSKLMVKPEPVSVKSNSLPSDTHVKIQESVDTLNEWLTKLDESTLSEPIVYSLDLDIIKKQLVTLKQLDRDLNREKPNYSYIKDRSRELIEDNPKAEWTVKLKEKVEFMNNKWSEIMNKLDARVEKLKQFENNLSVLHEESSSLKKWIKEVDNFFTDGIIIPDIESIGTQIEQCDLLLKDIESSLDPSMINIKLKKDEIMSQIDNNKNQFGATLEEKVMQLDKEWKDIQAVTKDKKVKLEQTLGSLKEINERIGNLEKEFGSVEDDNLYEKEICKGSLKSFEAQVKAMTKECNELKQKLSTFSENRTNFIEELTERLNNLQSNVEAKSDHIKLCSFKYGEWKRLIMMEKDWLNKLERKLERSLESAADAEEISENLSDLEDYLKHRPTDRWESIQLLSQQLNTVASLSQTIKDELDELSQRRERLDHEAHTRLEQLEVCINQAQDYDKQILSIDQWLNQIDQLLDQHIASDISASDIPEQIEVCN
jgi:dystrophin, putative